MSEPEMPETPFSSLQANAIEMHETMASMIEAGFTRQEAFTMLLTIVQSYILAQGPSAQGPSK